MQSDVLADAVSRLQSLDDEELLALWRVVRAGETTDWLTGRPFAFVLLEALARSGAEIVWPYDALREDGNPDVLDGVVYCAGLPPCLIHAPEVTGNVDVAAVTRLRDQIARRPAGMIGVCFSRSGFTAEASATAQSILPRAALILLWHGAETDAAVEQARMQDRLREKYRYAVEHGRADGPPVPYGAGTAAT